MGAAIEKARSGELTGTYHSPTAIDARLASASKTAHLVSPFPAAGALPEGCGIQIAMVAVDVENETYDVGGGKRGLAKSALDRIAHAVGISWDPMQSRRLDDGSDPYYAHFRAVGHYKATDGQTQTVIGSKEMDLRDGSPQVAGLWERYEDAKAKFAKGKLKYAAKEPTAQIREMRLHILAHAETKARLRAIRAMGLRTSYTPAELAKPFVTARVVFTGRTADPELRRDFAKMTAASFLGGVHSLYGEPTPAVRSLPAGTPPPPVGSVGAADDDFPDDSIIEHEEAPAAAAEPPPRERRASPPRQRPSDSSEGAHVIRFGRNKDCAIDDEDAVSLEDLEWYRAAVARNVADPDKARFRAADEAILAEIDRELARRRGEEEPPADDGAGDFEDESGWPE